MSNKVTTKKKFSKHQGIIVEDAVAMIPFKGFTPKELGDIIGETVMLLNSKGITDFLIKITKDVVYILPISTDETLEKSDDILIPFIEKAINRLVDSQAILVNMEK